MHRDLDARRRRHRTLARTLARLDDHALTALLGGEPPRDGWGRSQTAVVTGHRVFVKRIPVTARELATPESTENLFRLPSYYHYGVGSAGFGATRELLAHRATSSWVLDGIAEAFPLLHHHRVVEMPPRTTPAPDLEPYVRYWSGSQRIRRFMEARASAPAELLLFLEHVPHTAAVWLTRHGERFPWLLDEARAALSLMRDRGMLHMDAQAFNLLTDGERVYVTDFGLAISRDFALDSEERAFHARHHRYDEAELYYNLGGQLLRAYRARSDAWRSKLERRYGIGGDDRRVVLRGLLDHLEAIAARGELQLPLAQVAITLRYRRVIEEMEAFFGAMLAGSKKRAPFDEARLADALIEADAQVVDDAP
ncbi:MAG: protein kinase family protein [Sandaracinaceae bacterium]|nr:protein kinase family protein [Sandaracinaceae bacterium]